MLDATTGQNGLVQAKQFTEAVERHRHRADQARRHGQGRHRPRHPTELGIPIKLVGLGETAEDLIDFDPEEFVDALFS